MKFIKDKKVILGGGSIVVIILGIVTNAIWDVLKPATKFLFELTLNLSTLGVDKFKDGIYEEIAKGLHEGTSLQVFFTINGILLGSILVLVLSMVLIRRRILARENGNSDRTILDRVSEFNKDFPKKPVFVWFLLLYVLFAGTIFILDSTRQKYINNAVTHFEQLSKIVRPYVTDEQEELHDSIFSQIKNRDSYISLISELEKIARDNNQEIPKISFTF